MPKPFLPLDDQISKIKSSGIIISDEVKTKLLQTI